MRPTSSASRALLVLASVLTSCASSTGPDATPVPTRVTVSQASVTVDDEGTTVLAATVLDQSGAPMTALPNGLSVSWVSRDTSIIRVSHDSLIALRPGQTYLVASAGTLCDSASVTVRPVASQLRSLVPAGQMGSALEMLPDVAVAVTDRFGAAVTGATVSFAIVDGGGTLSTAQATSDAFGNVRTRWTMGPRTGLQHIRATLAGSHPAEVSIASTARPQLLANRQYSIALINVDNGAERGLATSMLVASDAAWSPDGRRIAFVGRPDNTVRNGVYVMNADGTGITLLTRGDSTDDAGVDWSPDGARMAFTRTGSAGSRVFVIGANGTGLAQLTNVQSETPRWSPDGSQIALSQRSASNQFMEIAVMNADGTNVRYVTSNDTDDYQPSWSPDGTQLVYVGWRLGRPRLFVTGVDRTGDHLLAATIPPNHLYDDGPAWSRDGSLIAFSRATSSVDGTTYSSGIYTINVDGTSLTPIASGAGALGVPRWRP